jgi:hypothetical protein
MIIVDQYINDKAVLIPRFTLVKFNNKLIWSPVFKTVGCLIKNTIKFQELLKKMNIRIII